MSHSSGGNGQQAQEGERRCLNSELWHACAGPLVSLPAIGSRVVYFPQGHSEQVAASTYKEIDSQIPNYPSLPPQLICQLHDVTMHADADTDEVYAQMTLQPLSPQEQKDSYLPAEVGTLSKQPTNYFCKTLTASDTSTHGGFSVPRRAAEKVFPPLDFTQQPPAQELIAKDLHDNEWKFRHIFRGQPKRHLLTTGWSVFVSAKRLVAGDSVLFIWNDNNQLLLGIRHANRPQTVMPSSVLSSDTMHIGLLAAAAHAAATNSRFTVFYNPRACPSEFVITLAKYVKAVYQTHVSVGLRFRMLFETEESSVRRYMGTITGICDLDPARWPHSHWRSVKVGWDESTAGDRQPRVSLWEIEPLTTFPMYPSPFPLRLKRPWPQGLPSLHGGRDDGMGMSSPLMWLRDANPVMQSLNFQGIGGNPWHQQRFDNSMIGLQPDMYESMASAALQEFRTVDPSTLLQFQQPQNIINRPAPLLPSQFLQLQSQMPQNFAIQDSHVQNQSQSNVFQHQLQHCQSFSEQQHQVMQQQQQQMQQQQMQHQQQQQMQQQQLHQPAQHLLQQQQQVQQTPVVTSISQPASASQSRTPVSQTISSFSKQRNFHDSDSVTVSRSGNSQLSKNLQPFSPEDSSHLPSLPRTNSVTTSGPWASKRIAVESMTPSETECVPHVEEFGSGQPNALTKPVMRAPFSRKESLVDQEDCIDPQNHLLFGVNIESPSLLVQNGLHNHRSVDSDFTSTEMPFTATNFLGNQMMDFPLSQAVTTSSCLEETGFLQSPENADQGNKQRETFVKVYKSGSFGRSLDITRFNSYPELRRELELLFGLDGQLEDPLRSGWQLVFVDPENEVLLVGDDPWQEFANMVWCIKILSPQEVQHMGKEDADLSSSAAQVQSVGSQVAAVMTM